MTATKTATKATPEAPDTAVIARPAPKPENLAEALAAFQAELPRVGKDNTATVNPKDGGGAGYQYKYADLSEITALVLPVLARHGLAWSTRPMLTPERQFVLRYALTHGVSGQQETGDYPLPAPGSSPQVLGSAITYARRYALCAVTGVAPGDDDDDAAAVMQDRAARAGGRNGGREQQQRQRPPEGPPAEVVQALDGLANDCTEHGWSQARVGARFAEQHGGMDIRRATAEQIQAFRSGLLAVSQHELIAQPEGGEAQ